MILAVKNLGNSHHTSVVSDFYNNTIYRRIAMVFIRQVTGDIATRVKEIVLCLKLTNFYMQWVSELFSTTVYNLIFCLADPALDTVQDFLNKLGIYLLEIVRPTKIMNRDDKDWAHFFRKKVFKIFKNIL